MIRNYGNRGGKGEIENNNNNNNSLCKPKARAVHGHQGMTMMSVEMKPKRHYPFRKLLPAPKRLGSFSRRDA